MSTTTDRRRRAYKVANAFPEGWGKIPNNPLVAAAVAAIFKGGANARSLIGGWSEEPDGRLAYRHLGKRGGQIVVYVNPEVVDDSVDCGERHCFEEQWTFVEGISPLTVDVLLAVFAQLCEPSLGNKSKYPLLAPVAITAAAILKYKGLKRWGEEGAALRRRVDLEIERLLNIRFDVQQFPAWDPELMRWNARGVSVSGDRLFDVVESGARGEETTNGEIVWLTRVGHWSQWWMNAQAKVWLGPMPQGLIALDHRRNRGAAVLAKKIGLNTMVLWGAVRARSALARRVDSLLESIGELPDLMSRDSHWAGRTRDRFDEAILMLQEAGVFSEVEWPDAFKPGGRDRSRGWVESWLSSKIVLHRPPAFGGAEEGDRRKATRKKARWRTRRDTPVLPEVRRGSVIRAMRTDRNMSQLQLARELGISAAYLSQIENERRVVSKGILIRLSTWLDDGSGAGAAGGGFPHSVDTALPREIGERISIGAVNG